MSKIKRMLAALLITSALIASAVPAYAAPAVAEKPSAGIITPCWAYLNFVANWMDIDGSGQASMYSEMQAYSGVTSVKITAYLQRLQDGTWTSVKSWTQTTAGTYGLWTKTYYVYSGYYYRLKTYFYAYVGSTQVESTSLTSGTCYY